MCYSPWDPRVAQNLATEQQQTISQSSHSSGFVSQFPFLSDQYSPGKQRNTEQNTPKLRVIFKKSTIIRSWVLILPASLKKSYSESPGFMSKTWELTHLGI